MLLAAAVMLGAAQQTVAQDRDAPTAVVRGRVVAADTGSPLREVRVTIMPVPTADADGIPVLSGRYLVVAAEGPELVMPIGDGAEFFEELSRSPRLLQ